MKYSTTDIYVATYLKYKGFKITSIDKSMYPYSFVFEQKDNEIEKVIREFWGEVPQEVIPLKFLNTFKEIKGMLASDTL